MKTMDEIVKDYRVDFLVAPERKKIAEVFGVDVSAKGYKAVLYYTVDGKNRASMYKLRCSLEEAFFERVKNGIFPMPSDYEVCYKCMGSGKTHYRVDEGRCWKCNSFGYIKSK